MQLDKEAFFCSQVAGWWWSALSKWPWFLVSEHFLKIVEYVVKCKEK